MIVLHQASRCDVCLDGYSGTTSDDTPHAIPCGHSFCKTCLLTLRPPQCPLCRKAFLPDRLKKLHIDRPEGYQPSNEQETDFLQRLALVSGESTPAEDIAEVMEEVELWVNQQPSDSHRPVRLAYDSLRRYQRLKDEKEKNMIKIKDLVRTLRHWERNAEQDKQTAKTVEEGLLSKIQDLEDDFEKKLADANKTIEELRMELGKNQFPSNPLPPSPEPVPLDRFPSFVRRDARNKFVVEAGSGQLNGNSHHHPQVSKETLGLYMNGYLPHIVGGPVSASAAIPGSSLATATIGPYTSTTHRSRSEGVPGATPTERVVPRKAKWDDSIEDYVYISEDPRSSKKSDRRVSADGLGPRAKHAKSATTSHPGYENNSLPGPSVRDPSAPAAAYVNGYENGFGSGYTYARDYVGYSAPLMQLSRGENVHDGSTLGGLGLSGLPPPPSTQALLSAAPQRPARVQRSATTSTIEMSRQFADLMGNPSPSNRGADRGSSGGRRGQNLTDQQSVSSWGTLSDTRRSLNTEGSSVADLELVGFGANAMPGDPDSTSSSLSTPLRLADEEGEALVGTDRDDDRTTPRMNGRAQLYPANLEHGGPLPGSISASHSAGSSTSRNQSDPETANHNQDTIRRRRNRHHHQQQQPASTHRPSSLNDPSQIVIAGNGLGTPESSSDDNSDASGNALSLLFTPGSPTEPCIPQISAPTPIVSTRNALRSWNATFNNR